MQCLSTGTERGNPLLLLPSQSPMDQTCRVSACTVHTKSTSHVSLPISVLYDQCSTSDPLTQIRGSLDLSTGFPGLCLPPLTHTQELPLLVILPSCSKILTEFLLTIPPLSQTPCYPAILADRRTRCSKLSSTTTPTLGYKRVLKNKTC